MICKVSLLLKLQSRKVYIKFISISIHMNIYESSVQTGKEEFSEVIGYETD